MQALWFACQHYLLHILISLIAFSLLFLLGFHPIFYMWMLGTFIVDLDHLVDWFNPKDQTEKQIVDVMERKNMSLSKKIKTAVGEYWKKGFMHLIFHNLVVFSVFVALFTAFLENKLVASLLGAMIIHQLVDIGGDIKRWGNINNWLWKKEK